MEIPTPLLLVSLSTSLCFLNVLVFPSVLPDTKITTLFLAINGVLFALWSFWAVCIYPRFQSPLRHLPQPKTGAIPLIGHPRVTLRQNPGESFLHFMNTVPNNGLIRFPGPLNSDWLLLSGPAALSEVLVTKSYDFEKESQVRNFLRIFLGDGLVIVEGDDHKFQRKHVSPAFSFRNIKELYPVFWTKAIDLVDCVTAELEGEKGGGSGVVEINHWANKVTMDIIGVAGLGREFNSLHNSNDELVGNYEEILEPTAEKVIFFGLNMIFPLKLIAMLPWGLNDRVEKTSAALRVQCHKLLADKKQQMKMEKGDAGMKDILSILLKTGDFGDDMLVDQLLTFLAAGHETTSSAFTWATYLLATHPEIQSQLRHEIRSNLPSPSSSCPLPENFDLPGTIETLPLLSAICNETLRLFPPIPITSRITNKPTSILSIPIPASTRIFLSPWATNRSSQIWGADASEFTPRRWIDRETGKANNHGGQSSNYNILTFLHGPRSCIGERFAKSELKALLAVFVGRLVFEQAVRGEVPVPAGAITTKPRDGMRLRLRRVEGW